MRVRAFVASVAVLSAACGGPARSQLHRVHSPGSRFTMRCTPTTRATVSVIGAVARPSEVPLDRAPTLGAALSAAGGTTKDARGVRIYLCAPDGEGTAMVGPVGDLTEDDLRVPLGPDALVIVDVDDD